MTRRNLLVPLLLCVALSVGAVLTSVLTSTTPVLGLDLQGGFSVVLDAKPVDGRLPSEESVEKAKDIIRQRVDGLGVAEPDITRQGRTVIVQLPGVKNREKAESLVGCTAKLEFRPVISRAANPDALPSTTTTKPKSKSTTTKPKDGSETTTTRKGDSTTTTGSSDATTTTTKPKATTTTEASDGEGETGMGAAGIAPGEGALPVQFAPTTTTTTAPTTTAPLITTTTAASATTAPATTVAGDTSTTAPAGTGSSSSCGGSDSDAKGGAAGSTTTTAPLPDGQAVFPSEDGTILYTLGPVGFSGDALSSAQASLGGTGQWQVLVNVKGSQKGKANEAFNACNAGAPTCPAQDSSGQGAIAIVLDGEVISAPTVQAQNLADDQFTITGDFSEGDAKDLALVLRYGSLPVEFEQAALQQVSATLGKDSLRAGLIAGAIGIAAVALYMILYYRGLGLVVVMGLAMWSGIMYGLVCWLGQAQGLALTLSGITGIIVSVGTTVDSYVVYFERIRDEVRLGKSVRSASERGFHSAIRTVITADVSSFIGAFLLWYLTVGPVRGFAFFLGVSVLLDLVVAYLFTRPLVVLLGRSKRVTNARFMGLASAVDRAQATGATA